MVSQHLRLVCRRLCVDLVVEIVCRSHDEVCRSLSSVGFIGIRLRFENLHRGGECRERIKNWDDRVFKLIEKGSVDRHTQEKVSVDCRSTDMHERRKHMLAINRNVDLPNSLRFNRELGNGSQSTGPTLSLKESWGPTRSTRRSTAHLMQSTDSRIWAAF